MESLVQINKSMSEKQEMVTITKEEDQILNSKGLRSKSKNSCRYQQSGIEVVCLESSPRIFFGAH